MKVKLILMLLIVSATMYAWSRSKDFANHNPSTKNLVTNKILPITPIQPSQIENRESVKVPASIKKRSHVSDDEFLTRTNQFQHDMNEILLDLQLEHSIPNDEFNSLNTYIKTTLLEKQIDGLRETKFNFDKKYPEVLPIFKYYIHEYWRKRGEKFNLPSGTIWFDNWPKIKSVMSNNEMIDEINKYFNCEFSRDIEIIDFRLMWDRVLNLKVKNFSIEDFDKVATAKNFKYELSQHSQDTKFSGKQFTLYYIKNSRRHGNSGYLEYSMLED